MSCNCSPAMQVFPPGGSVESEAHCVFAAKPARQCNRIGTARSECFRKTQPQARMWQMSQNEGAQSWGLSRRHAVVQEVIADLHFVSCSCLSFPLSCCIPRNFQDDKGPANSKHRKLSHYISGDCYSCRFVEGLDANSPGMTVYPSLQLHIQAMVCLQGTRRKGVEDVRWYLLGNCRQLSGSSRAC